MAKKAMKKPMSKKPKSSMKKPMAGKMEKAEKKKGMY